MSNQPNRAARRGSGLVVPPGMGEQQIPQQLLDAIQQQPSRNEQASSAGIQIAMAFNGQRQEPLAKVEDLIKDAKAIADFLLKSSGDDE